MTPMKWLESDETLQGALVRTLVLGQPREGDQERIDETVENILSEQKDDGNFGEEGKEMDGKLCELLDLGCMLKVGNEESNVYIETEFFRKTRFLILILFWIKKGSLQSLLQ